MSGAELAGHAAARALREAGIPWVTGVAGESFLPLLDGLRREGLPYVTVAQEGAATFLASAHARVTGRVAMAAVTRGPGASNAMIGIHEAAQAAAPVVLIVGQVESGIRGRKALQEMEFDRVFGSVAKDVFEVTRADQLVPSLLAAIRKAEAGRPGPVVVSVPADHFFEELPVAPPGRGTPVPARVEGVLPAEACDDLSALIRRAERGLLVVGRPFAGGEQGDLIARFAEATGFGVVGGHAHPDVMDTGHAHWLGCSTIRGSEVLRQTLREADTIVLLGHWLGDRVTQGYLPLTASLAAVVDDDEIGWDEYLGARLYTGSAVDALARLTAAAEHAAPAGRAARASWVAARRREAAADAEAVLSAAARPGPDARAIGYPLVLRALDELLPADATIVSDAGSFNDWFIRYFPYSRGRRYLGPLSGSMGFAIPGAIGAQLALPASRTVALTGDGAFLMTGMEISTAVSLSLPLTVVVFKNRLWGSIALHQDKKFTGNRFAVTLPDVSYAGLARALGASAQTVAAGDDVRAALAAALASSAVSVVEILTDAARPSPASVDQSREL